MTILFPLTERERKALRPARHAFADRLDTALRHIGLFRCTGVGNHGAFAWSIINNVRTEICMNASLDKGWLDYAGLETCYAPRFPSSVRVDHHVFHCLSVAKECIDCLACSLRNSDTGLDSATPPTGNHTNGSSWSAYFALQNLGQLAPYAWRKDVTPVG